MSEWELLKDYGEQESPSARTGYRWHRLRGEVGLSLYLGRDPFGESGRFEMRHIITDSVAVQLFAVPEHIERGLKVVSKGKNFLSEPFWEGRTPEELRKYFEEHRLPEPEGYAEAWRSFKQLEDF